MMIAFCANFTLIIVSVPLYMYTCGGFMWCAKEEVVASTGLILIVESRLRRRGPTSGKFILVMEFPIICS